MKSKFAKLIDGTIGAMLIFFAATAVFRYYTTLELAVFSGLTVASCAILLLHVTGAKRAAGQTVSKAAADMFYEFMFFDERTPAKFLFTGLKARTDGVKLRGKTVYLNGTAATCFFDEVSPKAVARAVATAKHYGAKKLILFCKTVPDKKLDISDFSVRYVNGDDTYKLFLSLGVVPKPAYSLKTENRASRLFAALGKDKIVKYLFLSCGLFFVSVLSGYKIIPFVCACIGGALFIASLVYNIAKSIKRPDRG